MGFLFFFFERKEAHQACAVTPSSNSSSSSSSSSFNSLFIQPGSLSPLSLCAPFYYIPLSILFLCLFRYLKPSILLSFPSFFVAFQFQLFLFDSGFRFNFDFPPFFSQISLKCYLKKKRIKLGESQLLLFPTLMFSRVVLAHFLVIAV